MVDTRPLSEDALAQVQRRSIAVLISATILGGLGIGASISAGALLITEVTGDPAISGFGATMNAVGAAIAGLPLGRFAARRGRRIALSLGNLIAVAGALTVIAAAALTLGWMLFLGLGVLGVASAVQLQSRFAAADLALPERRARDLSLVVWSITIGAVTGPNLIGPGESLGEALGLPGLAGVFVFTLVAQVLAGAVVWVGLRPDPLLEARRLGDLAEHGRSRAGSGAVRAATEAGTAGPAAQYLVIAAIALAHAVMVGLMAMTPLHLTNHGGSITVVGLTISLHIAGMYALSPVFGAMTSRFGAVPVMLLGFAVLAVSALGTAFGGPNVPVIQIALILLGVGWGMVTVAGAVLLTRVTPLALRPKRQGQSDTVMNGAGAVFGAASGVLFAVGGFPVLSIASGVLILLGVLATVKLAAETRR